MSDSPLLPGVHAWHDASGKPLPAEFYKFLRNLVQYIQQTSGNTVELADILQRLAALEQGGDFLPLDTDIFGDQSVRTIGLLRDGTVRVSLVGDVDRVYPGQLYGAFAESARGWKWLFDLLEGSSAITITMDGYTILGVVFSPTELPLSGETGEAYIINGILYPWDGASFTEGVAASGVLTLSIIPGENIGDTLIWDGSEWTVGPAASDQLFQRMDTLGDFRVTADGSLRVTN